MKLLLLPLRRQSPRCAACAAVALLALAVYGCGGSSNSSNGNMPASSVSTTTTGNTGSGANDGPPTVPPGTLLANAALPLGTWGGQILVDTGGFPTTLTVSSSGILVTLPCGQLVSYAKPIALDSTGSFNVQGTLVSGGAGTGATPVILTGQVAVSTTDRKSTTIIFLGVNDPGAQSGNGTYELVLGVAAPSTGVNCP